LQDVRGCGPVLGCRSESHGIYNFPNNSALDGWDTVEWISRQPWSNQRVGLSGPSALAIDSYELLTINPHPAIKASFLQIGQSAEHKQWFPGGMYRMGMAEIYLNIMADSSNSSRASAVIGELRRNEGWCGQYLSLSPAPKLTEHVSRLLSGGCCACCRGPSWSQQSAWSRGKDGLTGWARGRKAAVPTIHVGGWYDVFSERQLETYSQLNNTELGATAPQWLWFGPGGHCSESAVLWGPRQPLVPASVELSTTLFHLYLADPNTTEKKRLQAILTAVPKVSYYMVGPGIKGSFGNTWHNSERSWPAVEPQHWFLVPGGSLRLGVPGNALAPPDSLVFDPADPVGTSGGNNLFIQPCGPQDQNYIEASNETLVAFNNARYYDTDPVDCFAASCGAPCYARLEKLYQALAASSRPDILRYDSPPYAKPTAVLGNVSVELTVSSNATDTDFVAKLSDVFPNGTSMLIQKGGLRMRWREGPFATEPAEPLQPGRHYQITIEVGSVAYVLNKGHRLRLVVTSSTWPYFSVNPNTGARLEVPPIATHTVWPTWGPCEMGDCVNVTARNSVHFGDHSVVNLPVMHHLPAGMVERS
jgi:predicted acyl esterase